MQNKPRYIQLPGCEDADKKDDGNTYCAKCGNKNLRFGEKALGVKVTDNGVLLRRFITYYLCENCGHDEILKEEWM